MKSKNLISLFSEQSTAVRLSSNILDFQAQYKLIWILGKGGFGVVHDVIRKSDGMQVAVKEITKETAL